MKVREKQQAIMAINPVVAFARVVIVIAVAFHAAMVFLINSPESAFRNVFLPVLHRYNGPYVSQGWALFAPNPPINNTHVLVRARNSDGSISKWYDATLFFYDVVGPNRLNPVRELGEGLGHATNIESKSRWDAIGDVFITRTATMVLKLYDKKLLVAEQIELDTWTIPPPGSPQQSSVSVEQWNWQEVPDVEPLDY